MRLLKLFVVPVLAAITAFAPAQVIEKNPELKQAVLARITDALTQNAFVPGIDFSKWPDFLEAERSRLETASDDETFTRAVNSALRKFGASHIVLNTPKATSVRREAKNTGIGIGVAPDNGAMMITYVYAGSPAAKVGLNPGDRILEVNGKAISAGVQSIAGEEGSTVEIKVQKASGKIEDLSLVRKKYSTVKPEEFTLVDPDTAMLTVHTFDLTYNADRVETLVRKGIGKRNFILDLRGNGGGAVYNLQHLLSCFLAKDVEIGTFISRRVVEDYKEKTGKPGTDLADIANFAKRKVKVTPKSDVPRFVGNLVVLVNGSSGSASEMAAAALREVGGATIIGRKSAGAVLVSIIAPLTSGFTLQYPLSDYVTIKGLRLEGKGVTPDIEVNQPAFLIPNTPDTAVAKAQEVFQRIAQIDKL